MSDCPVPSPRKLGFGFGVTLVQGLPALTGPRKSTVPLPRGLPERDLGFGLKSTVQGVRGSGLRV